VTVASADGRRRLGSPEYVSNDAPDDGLRTRRQVIVYNRDEASESDTRLPTTTLTI